jgi:hypothetical protein
MIKSGPDTDTYGGGVRDNDLVGRVNVFSETLRAQLRQFFPSVEVRVKFSPGRNDFSYGASLSVSVGSVVFEGCFSVRGVLGAGEYSVEIFAKSRGIIPLRDLNFKLAVDVASDIRDRLGRRGGK